ncbi:T9SS type B sorting domain-containing protein [Ichthyenterobacterium magnum]|uniref:Gliding motility-associated-like protein n=1 Tax=Ichthyenterobacterium magnum TaxID=1230530 RepID=A0A420DH25_9FLAO|nr:gliding motility-associated C-terminal domain-containing protein [Ichthyenterobacterium magnum]RKE92379.1 gliding motility-associated-like protein [Ichthyenterobacterium magnum]
MRLIKFIILLLILVLPNLSFGQDIQLYQQFNGRYDYTAIGNTLNQFENNLDQSFCSILESSQATLNLSSDSTIIAAYLYWAGSGIGDENVTLNGVSIDAQTTYNVTGTLRNLAYFSCFADITDFVISEGNTDYLLEDLDISETLTSNIWYCENRTNFAGWSIHVIYEDESLPLNQLSVFQGLEIIDRNVQEKTIVLDNLNVLDNVGAKIGFLAWEGDNALNFGESLSINGNILSNPPLNLSNNAFNGTNTFTNSNTFYNCDLDVYNIQDNISIGDTSATIRLTTGELVNGVMQADLIILNTVVTVFNSQLPDATITIDDYILNCNSREVEINYTVYNVNSTDVLPANTPIAFYTNGVLITQSSTQNELPISASENNTITITLPNSTVENYIFTASVDDDGTNNGIITEINEDNNIDNESLELLTTPPIEILPNHLKCNEGSNSAVFNLIDNFSTSTNISFGLIQFYNNLSDLEAGENEILIPDSYSNITNPQTIYIKVKNSPCYEVYQFDILVENCPPHIPQGFSPNNDTINDWFNIQNLYGFFDNHELKIFNRYGTLIFEGNDDKPWYGLINRGINNHGNLVPVGTYFYILNLNDPNYKPMVGWVYVNY